MVNDSGRWRSNCINLDPYHVHKYGSASSPTWTNGERGSVHFITRLDLTDGGPLGNCSGSDKFRTCVNGGTSYLSSPWMGGTPEFMGDFSHHPRVDSSGNAQLAPFSETLPDRDPWTPITLSDPAFCPDDGSTGAEMFETVASLIGSGSVVNRNDLPNCPASGTVSGSGTFGGAVCKYDTTQVGYSHAGWYVDQ
ncbi:MAG: hypothetical protein JXR83_02580, partial [Deltaproteobacteria bacterium]|nr:hypothetical protein [Deltaproteobacteria bacterium]